MILRRQSETTNKDPAIKIRRSLLMNNGRSPTNNDPPDDDPWSEDDDQRTFDHERMSDDRSEAIADDEKRTFPHHQMLFFEDRRFFSRFPSTSEREHLAGDAARGDSSAGRRNMSGSGGPGARSRGASLDGCARPPRHGAPRRTSLRDSA
jgi:hypothetical protein